MVLSPTPTPIRYTFGSVSSELLPHVSYSPKKVREFFSGARTGLHKSRGPDCRDD
jgi:hypothetical protein